MFMREILDDVDAALQCEAARLLCFVPDTTPAARPGAAMLAAARRGPIRNSAN
jgi:hypothetical protein